MMGVLTQPRRKPRRARARRNLHAPQPDHIHPPGPSRTGDHRPGARGLSSRAHLPGGETGRLVQAVPLLGSPPAGHRDQGSGARVVAGGGPRCCSSYAATGAPTPGTCGVRTPLGRWPASPKASRCRENRQRHRSGRRTTGSLRDLALGSATSPTTSPEHSWKPADSGPNYTLHCEEPLKPVPDGEEHIPRTTVLQVR